MGTQEILSLTPRAPPLLGSNGLVQTRGQRGLNSAPTTTPTTLLEMKTMRTPSVSDTANQAGGSASKRLLQESLENTEHNSVLVRNYH